MQVQFEKKKKNAILLMDRSLVLKNKRNAYIPNEFIPFLRKYILEKLGREECDIILDIKDGDPEMFINYYKALKIVDFNYYDEIFIYNKLIGNFFGGIANDTEMASYKKLLEYKGDLWYFMDDPEYGFKNIIEIIKSRKKVCFNRVSLSNAEMDFYETQIIPKIKIIWLGLDYYKLNNTNKDWAQIPLPAYINSYKTTYKDHPFKREFDVAYFGVKRNGGRFKVLDSYFHNEKTLSKYWIGYQPDKEYHLTKVFEGSLPIDKLLEELCRGYSTLVLGSKLHNGNLMSPRYFQCMSSDIICFIHHEYEGGAFIKDKELRDLIVIKSIDEYKFKLWMIQQSEKLFREVVASQRAEIKSLTNL